MSLPIEYQIRTGFLPSLDQGRGMGATEDGVSLTVIGKKLQVGDDVPRYALFEANKDGALRVRTPDLEFKLPNRHILYTVNAFNTSVCAQEASIAEQLVKSQRLFPEELYGVSNETPSELSLWKQENPITHTLLSASRTDFGARFGVTIKEWGGDLQRALFAISGQKVVYAEYIYDQGGPLPDFNAAIQALGYGGARHGLIKLG